MKKLLILFAFTLVATLYFTSCEPDSESYSPQERMAAFLATANTAQWSDLKQHTHPASADYNTADALFWSNAFETQIPLIKLIVTGQTATCTNAAGSATFYFYLTADGDNNNLINHIERDTTPVFR